MQRELKIRLLLAAALLLAVLATYSNHFHNAFHFDDFHTIESNVFIRDLRNIPLFFRDGSTFSTQPTNRTYRPVVSATLAVDYWLGNGTKDTFFFHLSNFLLFLLQGLFMYFLALAVYGLSSERRWVHATAFLSVAWYLLHPANAETVNYVIARSDAISTCSVVVALVLFIRSPLCRRWQLYLLPVAVGALAKPTALVFAPLLLTYLLLFEERASPGDPSRRGSLARLLAAGRKTVPASLACIALAVFIARMNPPTWRPGTVPWISYVSTQPFVLLHYAATLFLPLGLSADTDLQPFASLADWRFGAGSAFLVALVWAAAMTARRERLRPICFGLLWFLVTSLPTSLMPLDEVMNDHRMFLPLVGLVMGVGWAAALALMSLGRSFANRRSFAGAGLCAVLLLLAAYALGTRQRNAVWKTEETLWRDVAAKSPGNGRGLLNYGSALLEKGDYAGAEDYFTRAMKVTRNQTYLKISMGLVKTAIGKPHEAEEHFRKAVAEEPHNPQCYYFYGRFLAERGRRDEALVNLEKSVRLDRERQLSLAHLDTRYLLMKLYLDAGNGAALEALADDTLRIVPGDSAALFYRSAARMSPSRR